MDTDHGTQKPNICFTSFMTNKPDKRFLVVAFVFGIFGFGVGIYWVSYGTITIREGDRHTGSTGAVAGQIDSDDVLFYPLCIAWMVTSGAMIILAAIAFLSSKTPYSKLSAYSLLGYMILAVFTAIAAMSRGP